MNWKVLILSVVVVGGLLGLGGGLYWWKTYGPGKPPPQVGFEPAEAIQVVQTRTASWRPTANMVGTVFALRSVNVRNEVAGAIKEVHFETGSIIEQGQPLLTLDTKTEEADLKAAEAAIAVSDANLHMAESNLLLAESNWKRMEEAVSMKAVAAMEADRVKNEVAASKATHERMIAEVAQAKARAEQVRTTTQKKRIFAPFKGRTGLRTVHPGQYLAEGSEVVMLQGIDPRIYLDFALPQEEAWRVKPGGIFMVNSPVLGPEPIRVEVVGMDAQVNAATRNMRVRSIVDNPGEILRPGMSVDVSVPIDEPRDYTVVPMLAVRRATYGDHVFVIAPSTNTADRPGSSRAQQRFIKLGPTLGEDVIVTEGLKPGEQVASIGSFKLREGALVNITDPNAPPPAPPGKPTAAGGH